MRKVAALAGIVLALALLPWSSSLASSAPKPGEQLFRWRVRPQVRICAQAELSEPRVREAMDWWVSQGHQFGALTVSPCAFAADGTPLDNHAAAPAYNVITVTRLGQLTLSARAGATRWSQYGEVPRWAVIELPAGPVEGLALEHEFGHALGFPHLSRRGSIMNPRLEFIGESTERLVMLPEVRTTGNSWASLEVRETE